MRLTLAIILAVAVTSFTIGCLALAIWRLRVAWAGRLERGKILFLLDLMLAGISTFVGVSSWFLGIAVAALVSGNAE